MAEALGGGNRRAPYQERKEAGQSLGPLPSHGQWPVSGLVSKAWATFLHWAQISHLPTPDQSSS